MNFKKTTKNLPVIAAMLGEGWRFNQVLSENHRGFLLTNNTGLIIDLHTNYSDALPQWALCFKHPKYKDHYPRIATIGCSLEKSISAICDDLKNRLINSENMKNAQAKFACEHAEHTKKTDLKINRGHVIAALESVLNIEHNTNHRDFLYSIKNDNGDKVASINHTIGKIDSFSFSASGLSAEKIIKIMQTLNN